MPLKKLILKLPVVLLKVSFFSSKKFKAINTELTNVEVCAYDFFAHQVLTDFDGVLGLDFFKGVKFCIDMNKSEITIQ